MVASAYWLAAVVLSLFTGFAHEQCMHPNPAFNKTYGNFTCPAGTSCVVDTRNDPSNQLYLAIPVGCCPDNTSRGCFSTDALMGIGGCCGQNQSCCWWEPPLQRKWIGCANRPDQCCVNQICPDDYFCCRTRTSHGCCPVNTTCYSNDYQVYPNVSGLPVNFTALFGVTYPVDLCIPIPGKITPVVYPVGDRNQSTNRGLNGDLKPENWLVDIRNSTGLNTTKCGRYLCREGDVCINRYWNATAANYTVNTTVPGCNVFFNNVAFNEVPQQCRIKHILPLEKITARGCCPANHTPCGRLENSFAPVDPALPQLQNPFDRMMGCVGPNETCCYPQICPVGMKCCSGVWSIRGNTAEYPTKANGYIVPGFAAGTVNSSTSNGTMIGFGNSFSLCCPIGTTCCQIATQAPSQFNQWGEIFAFCGADSNCTLNAYHPQYLTYSNLTTSPIVDATESLADILSEGFNPRVRQSSSSGVCQVTYGDSNFFNLQCGQLGGDFQLAEPQYRLPTVQTYRDNTNPTQQVVIAYVYGNVSVPKVPQRPRIP